MFYPFVLVVFDLILYIGMVRLIIVNNIDDMHSHNEHEMDVGGGI